jgi:hypothetical protein
MEMGSELSKTVATFIVQKILLDDVSACPAGRVGCPAAVPVAQAGEAGHVAAAAPPPLRCCCACACGQPQVAHA